MWRSTRCSSFGSGNPRQEARPSPGVLRSAQPESRARLETSRLVRGLASSQRGGHLPNPVHTNQVAEEAIK